MPAPPSSNDEPKTKKTGITMRVPKRRYPRFLAGRFVGAAARVFVLKFHRSRSCLSVDWLRAQLDPVANMARAFFATKRLQMKVKTFVGNDAAKVDKQVNDWLAESKLQVGRTSTAFKRLRYIGEGSVAGLPPVRHGVGIAISVWYDEQLAKPQIRTWSRQNRTKDAK
jgi:hypothetical protein